MNQTPQEYPTDPNRSRVDENRRRRSRKLLIPTGHVERIMYLREVAKRLVPGVEFFAFSLVAGLVITLGILLDSPAIYILGALLAPFMIPVVGLGFSTAIGSLGFFLRSTAALLIGAGLVFTAGALGGWVSRLFPELSISQALRFTAFTVPDFLLLTIGAAVAIYLTIREPKKRSLVASVPLAYEIYTPIAIAGFGFTSHIDGLFPQALRVAAVHAAWVILTGTVILAILKLRPVTFFGYLLTAVILGAALYGLIVSSALGSALERQVAPFITQTPKIELTDTPPVLAMDPTQTPTEPAPLIVINPTDTPQPTNTLAPTRTPTLTITPKPTPVWAMVFSEPYNGVVVRVSPGFNGDRLTSLQNEQPVQVLPDVEFVDNTFWAHVLLDDGTDGWMVRSYLVTATPVPGW